MNDTKQDSEAAVYKRKTRRELIVEALVKNHVGLESSDFTIGKVMGIMGITIDELRKAHEILKNCDEKT
jgi:hypothetical protein